VSDAEFLEVGERRGPGLPLRLRLVLVAGAVLLVVAGLVVDRETRQREERAVASCATETNDAVGVAGSQVRAAYEYVRPSLTAATPELQAAVRRVIEKSAAGATTPLDAPQESCNAVGVLFWHDDLQARRDRCVEVLRAHESGLTAVAADGGELGDWLGTPRTC
jgi:hypothetical protein